MPIAEPEFTKVRINENPLLKVPPARRGNRVGARRGSPREAGGTLRIPRANRREGVFRAVQHRLQRLRAEQLPCGCSVRGSACCHYGSQDSAFFPGWALFYYTRVA